MNPTQISLTALLLCAVAGASMAFRPALPREAPKPAEVPKINAYSVSGTPTMNVWERRTLWWDVDGATKISISGIGEVKGSSVQVTPTTTTTYVLTASNAAGTVSGKQTIVVVVPLEIRAILSGLQNYWDEWPQMLTLLANSRPTPTTPAEATA